MTAAPLLAALLLSAPAAPAPRPPAAARAPAGQRAEIVVRFPPWQFTGTFTLQAGALQDHGTAHDRGSLTVPEPPVERVLTGELGTVTLSLRGEFRAGFPAAFGRWQVTGATGAYQGLTGGGTFTSTDLGTGKELRSPFELQALLGRVVVPRRTAAFHDPGAPPPAALRPAGPSPER